uniref:Lysosomal dipeptide transporter MFSD1 n=1 Tax=Oncorhynchus tshawytscha TaxID=74940 RepID=A0A8C8HZT5_ONCTS
MMSSKEALRLKTKMAEERQNLLDDEGDISSSGPRNESGPVRPMSALCDPRRLPHRIFVLLFMCFLGFGSYFCYDNPAALQTQVIQDMKLNTSMFMQLYAWYSWPNVVLCFLGGFLLDRVFGIRLGTIIFALFVCVGQVIVAVGALLDLFWLMEIGRFVFGIGGESLAVAQNTYAVNWFKGKELNLVFGLQLSMARLGSTVNMNIMGWVYNRVADLVGSTGHTTLGVSLMIAGATCIFSLVCALVLGYLDKRAERILNKEQGATGEVIKLTDVKDFPFPLWLIFIICVGYYVAIFPFIGLGQVFFIEKFNFSPQEARAINSIVYIISAPASPVLGFMVDRTGKNVIWVLCAVVTTLIAHMMLAFTFWNPWIAMVMTILHFITVRMAQSGSQQNMTLETFSRTFTRNLVYAVMSGGPDLDAGVCLMISPLTMLFDILLPPFLSFSLFSSPCHSLSSGGDLNLSASARAKLLKDSNSE